MKVNCSATIRSNNLSEKINIAMLPEFSTRFEFTHLYNGIKKLHFQYKVKTLVFIEKINIFKITPHSSSVHALRQHHACTHQVIARSYTLTTLTLIVRYTQTWLRRSRNRVYYLIRVDMSRKIPLKTSRKDLCDFLDENNVAWIIADVRQIKFFSKLQQYQRVLKF